MSPCHRQRTQLSTSLAWLFQSRSILWAHTAVSEIHAYTGVFVGSDLVGGS